MRVLILGCGYVGLQLGAELVRQGHEVFGVRRSWRGEDAQTRGIHALTADVTQTEQLRALPGQFDWVVNTVSSSKGGVEAYRQAYVQGNRNLAEWLRSNPAKKFVYTSSTSVYGQEDGSQVKEESPTTPTAETAQVLVEAEKVILTAFENKLFSPVILRVAGIYGPDRGHAFKQFLANEVKIPGRGERIMNMVHLEDLVAIIILALKNGRPGQIYNVVDDEPVAQVHFYRWLAETLGKWMPPFTAEEPATTKRGLTNKKVLNRKLKMELGYHFKYPTFRQGYTAEIQRLQDAGLLQIEPEPR